MTDAPIRIKLLGKKPPEATTELPWRGKWIFLSGKDVCEYDWLVVYDEMPPCERLACPRENTLLLTSEPRSIKHYGYCYPAQFGHVLTNQPLRFFPPNAIAGAGYYKWFYGKSHAQISALTEPPEKPRILSAVCSSKQQRHTAHHSRWLLVNGIARSVPELEWFGRGVKPIAAKYEALEPFRYHLAIENHIAPGHWSEKIADALLGWTLPFYAGDPTLGKVLPPESFIPIPIDNPAAASEIIREAIATDQWHKRLDAIREARRLLLEKYNMWDQIVGVISLKRTSGKTGVSIRSRRSLRRNPLNCLREILHSLR